MTESAALLYTDLVDSTRLGEQLGEAPMLALWEAHDRAARDLVRQWQGLEIGRSDGFLLMFPGAAQALAFAEQYHDTLRQLHPALKTRVGLHVGPVRLRVNSEPDTELGATRYDLDGAALPVVARVMSAATAGQTLLTAAALAALGPDAAPTTSHGHWRLKGVDEPVELFEAHHADAPLAPPPDSAKVYQVVRRGNTWVPRREVPNNLPAERDAFVGRADLLRQLADRFDAGTRLLTLLGTGGTGKTRAAVRFGQVWLGDFPGGVSFCDLSQSRSLDDLLRAVAQGLDVPLGSGDPVEQLARAIAGRGPALVILDNFEQVAALAAQTLGRWLDRTQQAAFLVTSRAVLGLPGETVVQLDPLAPAEGTELFLLRAEAAAPTFKASTTDRSVVDELVRLLDGLPLAIELAAARVRLAPPQALLQRMGDRFRLLAVGGGRSDRQATLRGALDWSWDLLSDTERSVLAQLSVFEGGFTLAAAEAVLALPDGETAWSLDVVQSLIEKSLVRTSGGGRMDLLQSIQQYAAEHLATPGRFAGSGAEALAAAVARHGRYFAGFDDRAAAAEGGIELDNLAAACRRAITRGDAGCAAGSLLAAWAALLLTGPYRMAVELARQVAAMPDLLPAERTVAEGVLGNALCQAGHMDEAERQLRSAIVVARDARLSHLETRWLCAVAEPCISTGRLDAAADALAQAQQAAANDDPKHMILNGLASVAMARGQLDDARKQYEAALDLARGEGDRRWVGGLLSNLGVIAYSEGRTDDSRDLLQQALQLASSVGDRRWQGSASCNLALLLHEQGEHVAARDQFEATLQLARSIGHARLEATVLCNLGLVHEAMGESEPARQYLDAAVRSAHDLHDQRSEGLFRSYLGRVQVTLGDLVSAGTHLAEAGRLLRDGGDSTSLGLLLSCRAYAACRAGDALAASSLLDEARARLEASGAGVNSELGRAIEDVRRLLPSTGNMELLATRARD